MSKDRNSFYVGVDLSTTAVDNAKRSRGKGLPGAQAVFIAADADKFTPEDYSSYNVPVQFDVIIFNEVLYYAEHKKMMLRYKSFLKPHGVVIISCFFKQNVNTIKDVIIADANVRTVSHCVLPTAPQYNHHNFHYNFYSALLFYMSGRVPPPSGRVHFAWAHFQKAGLEKNSCFLSGQRLPQLPIAASVKQLHLATTNSSHKQPPATSINSHTYIHNSLGCTHTYIRTHILHTYIRTHILHIHTYIHIHTHIHTHTCTCTDIIRKDRTRK